MYIEQKLNNFTSVEEVKLYHWLPLDVVLHTCPAVHKLAETRQFRQPGSETEFAFNKSFKGHFQI